MIKLLTLFAALLLPCASLAKIIGEENGRIVSADPYSEESILAGSTGPAVTCKIEEGVFRSYAGTMSIIRHNSKLYLVGAAHAVYREGSLKCLDGIGMFFPNKNLRDVPGVDRDYGFQFQLPPLNHETALKVETNAPWDDSRLNDFVILELLAPFPIIDQLGQPRTTLTLARVPRLNLITYSQENRVTFISRRRNFFDRREESIQYGCTIVEMHEKVFQMKHDCDSGGGSSGASLLSARHDRGYYSLGIHYAGIASETDDIASNLTRGNYFIPSEHVLTVLESLVGIDYYNPELWLSSTDLNDIVARKSTICTETPALCQMYTYAVSDFLRSQSPVDYPRAVQILRRSAIAGFGPALMDLAALQEFETATEIQALSAQWPRSGAYYEHLFNLKAQFPSDIEKAAAAYILALQSGDKSLLARPKDGWSDALARALQTRLASLGLYSGPIDGDFGRGSMAAIVKLCACQ